jgi:hypothetical protein
MGQRAYCDQPHPGGDAEADRWCELYHRPACPAGGEHVYELQEEWGTGRTGWACQECHAPAPEQDDRW